MMEDIVLGRIDTELLEEQRRALSRVINCAMIGRKATRDDLHLIGGLQHMLDAWSDGRLALENEAGP